MKRHQFNKVKDTMKYILYILVLFSANSYAQFNWNELNFKQQKLLLPFESKWNGMDAKTREKLIENTNKWLSMTPEEQRLSHQKLNKFRQLPAEEQQRIKTRAQQFKNLSPQQRRQLKEAHRRFKQLKPDQKRKLRQRYGQMSPQEQIKEINKFKRHKIKMKFINEFDIEKRRPIIAMFKELKEPLRKKLRQHIIHLPAHKRHVLTLKLLDMGPLKREKYIQSID